jgi:hypothetical protein
MRRARILGIGIAFALTAAPAVSAQQYAEPTGKNFHKLISLDSVQLNGIVTSPDRRWLMFSTACSLTACSAPWGGEDGIWIMPSDGHAKPTRLLSPGHIDRQPAWFPSGDRMAFVSDRVSRDGSHKTYVMSVAIDQKTGTVVGQPQQITTDEAVYVGQISPDGKLLSYWIPGENSIKVVPATGGAARTLVKMPGVFPPFIWARDGKTLYFVVLVRGTRSGGTWYKVSVDGGAATRAYQNPAAMPYAPNTDMHVVQVRRGDSKKAGVQRVELFDAKDRLVGAADSLTDDMAFYFPRGTSDGMYVQSSNRRHVNYLVSLEDGTTRPLAASRFAWVDGWLDNSTLTVDGKDANGGIVATLDTAGHEGAHVTLPADAGGCCGWNGVVGSAVSFWRGDTVYSADARTGAIKKLTANATGGPSDYGRGGFYSDGDRFLVRVVNGQQVELRGITRDGRSTLLRAFAKSDPILTTAVNGDLVAWAIASHDSVTIFSARGPTGRPHRLTAQRNKPGRFFQIAWSFDATMLAITGLTADPPLSVIHVDESGVARGAAVILNPRATEPWTLRWTPDNRSVVVTATPIGAKDEVLMRVPIDPKEAPTFYARNDEWAFVSPDGKHAAYPSVRTLGTTIWWVDFVPAGNVGLAGKP